MMRTIWLLLVELIDPSEHNLLDVAYRYTIEVQLYEV